jgi:TPP-dependent pyruvate/acetoin dehydrogenase alpha subunit
MNSCSSVGHHSTSDDSFAYRARSEVEDKKRVDNPIARFRSFLQSQGWWDAHDEEELKARLKDDVMRAFTKAESLDRCELGEMFTDVYGGEEPWNIVCSLSSLHSPEHNAPPFSERTKRRVVHVAQKVR